MNRPSALLLAICALLAIPLTAQLDEAEPQFTLESSRTWAPGEKPSIRMYGTGIRRLQFRVYRVNDPVAFFSQLSDPHYFGGAARRAPGELTTLERIHDWKRRTRLWIRNLIREQYTADSREEIRTALAKGDAGPPAATKPVQYADLPLLNSQQVVSVWEQLYRPANRWEGIAVPIEVKGKGVYLVEATTGALQAYTIVCVSDLSMITKAAGAEVLARVVERRTGQPVAGASLSAWSAKKQLATAETDKEGLARFPLSLEEMQDAILLARSGDDVAPDGISSWALRSGDRAETRAYIYTDRPVYRPGHQVHWKSILRTVGAGGYEIPTKGGLQVDIEDPEGKPVLRRALDLSRLGTADGDLTLKENAALGYYGITVRANGRYVGTGGFQVEEYRKPEYEVRVNPEQSRYLQGNTIRAGIEARYFFGEPVPGAQVTWVVHRSRYWPAYWSDEPFEDPAPEEDEFLANEQILEKTGALDASGKLTIQFPSEKAGHDLRYRIEARVTDEAGREISGTGYAIATRGSFFVYAEPESYVYAPSDTARIRVEIRDYDGNAVPNTPFRVRVVTGKTSTPVSSGAGTTDERGIGYASVSLRAGPLKAIATATTPEGQEVEDTTYLWVGGAGFGDWSQNQRIEIVPDKKSYQPGETARVLLVTGIPDASIWVTTETRGVTTSRVVRAQGSSVSIEVPVQREYSPNFFVAAAAVRDGELYSGTRSITVPPSEHLMKVDVQPAKPQFKPGESAEWTVEAKDHQGRPVSGAEFSLGIVDEAIYSIRKEAAQDMASFFYGRIYNSVQTSSSLNYRFSGSSGKRRLQLARLNTERRAQLKPDKFVDPRVRKAFPDTIYWTANLRTDANGRARVPVEFPDSLTTWRATARGVTEDTKVGAAIAKAIVRKDLILRLATPRFFMQGDEVVINAIVQNYLASAKTVRVSLEAKGLEIVSGGTQDVQVPPRGSAQVQYRVRAGAPGDAVILGKALTNEESDALELTIPVKPYGVALTESRSGTISEDDGRAETELAFRADANPLGRTMELSLSPSVAGALFGALDYLTTFPYGCTEQTMSSFLPNVIVSRAAQDLGLRSTINESELARKIRAGLERLRDFQHEDGAWGWWKADDGDVFMTAYVVAGLARAKAAGVNIGYGMLETGAGWLQKNWASQKEAGPDLLAYVAFALGEAGIHDEALRERLWSERETLSPYGQALLGLALRRAGDGRADQVAKLLEGRAQSNDLEVWWEVQTDPLLRIYTNTSVEATSYALKFLAEQRQSSPLLAKAALYLVNHRDQGSYWNSTKQTAMVIYGLTDYLKVSGELDAGFTATAVVNGREILSRRFSREDVLTGSGRITVPADVLRDGVNKVELRKSGSGRLYWGAQLRFYSTADGLSNTGDRRLRLTREYFRLVPQQSGDRIVHRLEPLGSEVKPGDVLAVRLRVTGDEWRYLMLRDPIPAGTEIVPRNDLYELAQRPPWWARGYARREYRDDHAALFETRFREGESEHTYLLKVVNPGRFRVPPARVEPMYQPDIFATTDSRVMETQ